MNSPGSSPAARLDCRGLFIFLDPRYNADMEIIREGRWVCPSCNTKNKGSHQKCSGCGGIRGEVAFIYDESAEVIADEAGQQRALAGADWICTFCGGTNPFTEAACRGCSAPKSDGKLRAAKTLGAASPDSQHPPVHGAPPPPPPSMSATSGVRTPASPCASGCARLGCGFLVLLFLAMMVLESCDYQQILEVTRRDWERTLSLQEYKTVTREDWHEKVPARATVLSREEKIRRYKKVQTGYTTVTETYSVRQQSGTRQEKTVTDLGNGRFKETYKTVPVYRDVEKTRQVQKPTYRDEPVRETFVRFQVDEWVTQETPRASGSDNEPVWPDQGYTDSALEAIGRKRTQNRHQAFVIHLQSLKDKAVFTEKELNGSLVTLEQYQKLVKGTRWKAVLSGLGNLKFLDLSAPQ
jgi:hypothetical protein